MFATVTRDRAAERNRIRKVLCKPLASPSTAVMVGAVTGQAIEKGEKAKPGKGHANAQERAWMDAISAYGCVACRLDGLGYRPAAVHHILRGGRRMGHLHTLPLCDPGHHQNGGEHYPSRHPWKAKFQAKYGTEMELLARLRAEIGATTE